MVYLYFCFVILEYLNRVTIGPNGSLICYRLKSHVIYIKYFKEIASLSLSLSLNLLCLSLYPFISDYFLFKLTGQTAILSPTYSFVFSWAKRVRKNLSRTKCFFAFRPSVCCAHLLPTLSCSLSCTSTLETQWRVRTKLHELLHGGTAVWYLPPAMKLVEGELPKIDDCSGLKLAPRLYFRWEVFIARSNPRANVSK